MVAEQLDPQAGIEQMDPALEQQVDQAFAATDTPTFDAAAQKRREIEEDAVWMIHEAENRPPSELQVKAEEDAAWDKRELDETKEHNTGLSSALGEARKDNEELGRQMEEAVKAAHTDALTGLPNRNAFTSFIDRKVAANPEQLSLINIDLDGFKEINDTRGHAAGDKVLQEIAGIMSHEVREDDQDVIAAQDLDGIAARIGGDEFVMAIEGAPTERVREIVENVLKGLNSKGIDADGNIVDVDENTPEGVTPFAASIGIAEFKPGMSTEQLLETADAIMYKVKKSGKNQIATESVLQEAVSA